MPTQVYVAGPAFIYAAACTGTLGTYPAGNAHSFLGQTEGDLQLTEQMFEEDVHVDMTGPRVPFDVQIMGKEMYMGGTLVKYSEAVWQALAARLAGGVFGSVASAEVGTLIRTERRYFQVVLVCPYAAKSVMTGEPPGFTFPCAWLHNAWEVSLSTQRKRQRFAIRCLPDWIQSSQDGSVSGVLASPTIPSGLPIPN